MPTMIPVAQDINPPDMGKSLSNLSSIIGLKQQQQALQTGAYQQQTAQAESQQAQQQNTELQAARQVIMNGVKAERYKNKDGSFNRSLAADDITAVAPTYGGTASNQLLSGANEMIANKNAVQDLNGKQQGQIAGMLQGLATKADLTNSDVIDAFNTMADINPTPEFRRMLMSNLAHMPQGGDSRQLQGAIQQMQAGLSGMSQQTPSSVDTGTAIKPGATNRFTGAFTPAGPEVRKDVAGVASASSRASGVAITDIDRSNQVSQAANQAPAAIQLSKAVDDLAEQISSGKISKALSSAAAAAGIDPVSYARQVLNKDLGQLKTLASANAASDARMGTILSGYPDDTSATRTIHTAMDYIRGSARQSLAKGQNLNSYRTKQPDLTGFQHSDDVLTQGTSPLMHEFSTLKTPAQQAEFYKRNFPSAEAAREFRNKVRGAKHHGLITDGE